MKQRQRRERRGKNQFFGALGAAAEGAEEEDGDGTGEEDAGGDLERGGLVGIAEGHRGRRRRELNGAVVGRRRRRGGVKHLRQSWPCPTGEPEGRAAAV